MSKRKWGWLGATSVAALIVASPANAQVSAQQVERLQQQIEAMQRELKALRDQQQQTKQQAKQAQQQAKQAQQAYAAASTKVPVAPPTAIVKMSPGNRPSICTPDGLNCIAFTSRLHLDTGGYWYDPNTRTGFLNPAGPPPQHLDSGVNARRARIGV